MGFSVTSISFKQITGSDEIIVRTRSRNWFTTRKTELRINAWGFEAKGDLGGYRRGTVLLPWDRIQELFYAPAGGGALDGLYARQGEWCSRCLLPWVTEAQADEVIVGIVRQFSRARTICGNLTLPSIPANQPATSLWSPHPGSQHGNQHVATAGGAL